VDERRADERLGLHVTEGDALRREDAATFSGATTPGLGRPPAFLLGFLVLLVGIVVAGVGGRGANPGAYPASPAALASMGPTVPATSAPAASIAAVRPVVTSEPGPIVLKARRNAATVYVHGEVFAPRVTWIYVALQDAAGRVAGWTSLSLPYAGAPSSDPVGDSPILFDAEVTVPGDTYPGQIFVLAHAHDADGALVGTAQLELAP
jgi:hypothetical protein